MPIPEDIERILTRIESGADHDGDKLLLCGALRELPLHVWHPDDRWCGECGNTFNHLDAGMYLCRECELKVGQESIAAADDLVDAQWEELEREGVWTLEDLKHFQKEFQSGQPDCLPGTATGFLRFLKRMVEKNDTGRVRAKVSARMASTGSSD